MEIIGKILRIEPLETFSEKFKKRRVVVDITQSKYPQLVEFTLAQGNVDIANTINRGDEVKVLFELKGKEVTDKHGKLIVFNTLDAYRINVIKKSLDFAETPEANEDTDTKYSDDESLPF